MADDILKNIPLPADLPENWTSNQTIAPTGAEAGLDNQHGYNYLMRQVNNAQKALKALAAQREEDLARIKFWFSDDPTSPASFIGGTWERIEGKFIMGASDTYPAGSTGGSATHSQTASEVARHNHNIGTNQKGTELTVPQWKFYITSVSQVSDPEGYKCYGMSTFNTGDGAPMDILNPYYSAYIWRRVA